MSDKLTDAQFLAFSAFRMRQKVTREAYIDNAAIAPVYIHERVKSWGEITFSVYNRHPNDSGTLRFPLMDLLVDNSDHYFDRGGAIFPNGNADFASTVVHAVISIGGVAFMTFDGRILQPQYDNTGAVHLIAEHPLTAMTQRKWTRDDRIGGATGIGAYFAT